MNNLAKRKLPFSILIFELMAYLLPPMCSFPFFIFTGGMTLDESLAYNSNPVSIGLFVVAFILGLTAYFVMNSQIRAYDGTPAGDRKLNKQLKVFELMSFVGPISFVIISPIIVATYQWAQGLRLQAFFSSSYTFYCFTIMFDGLCLYSVLAYILLVSNSEKALDWLPYKKEYQAFSFMQRCLLIVGFIMIGVCMIIVSVLVVPANLRLPMGNLILTRVVPFAAFMIILGLVDMFIQLIDVNKSIKLVSIFSEDLSNKNYRTPKIPVLIRCELGDLANSLNAFLDLRKTFSEAFSIQLKSAETLQDSLKKKCRA